MPLRTNTQPSVPARSLVIELWGGDAVNPFPYKAVRVCAADYIPVNLTDSSQRTAAKTEVVEGRGCWTDGVRGWSLDHALAGPPCCAHPLVQS